MSDQNTKITVQEKPYHPIFPGQEYEKSEADQFTLPTWFLLVFLMVFFVILKKFIYIKDTKRHGK